MAYSCVLHGWYSDYSMCPSCVTTVTTSGEIPTAVPPQPSVLVEEKKTPRCGCTDGEQCNGDCFYPGHQYQRLFNAIHGANRIMTTGEMDEVISIVHADFPMNYKMQQIIDIAKKETEGIGKTAMQQLLENCKAARVYIEGMHGEFYDGQRIVYDVMIESVAELLELEKQQITGSIVQGIMKDHGLPYGIEYLGKVADAEVYAESYYTTTFKSIN